MKVIHRDDLMILIPMLDDIKHFDLDDFKRILNSFGDDYHIKDSCFVCTQENEKMRAIREMAIDDRSEE